MSSTFQLIAKDEVPETSRGGAVAFRDALEAALANPEGAVKLTGLSQRQRNRLANITAATAHNTSKYAGVIKATSVRIDKENYDVYLTAQAAPAVPLAT